MISSSLRQRVRANYDSQCGYCGVRESDVGSRLTIDHFCPRSHGGSDEIGNLVYCCHSCNEFKGNYWSTEKHLRILHPLQDPLSEHIAATRDGKMRPLTTRGAKHIECLHLNRAELVAYRQQRIKEAKLELENRDTLQLLNDLRADNEVLRQQLALRQRTRKQTDKP